MKRDWELLGRIFNAVENENLKDWLDDEGEDEQRRIVQHIELLTEAGLIKGVEIRRSMDGHLSCYVNNPRITLKGYDYAELVQDKKLLNRTVKAIGKAGLMVTWESLKAFTPRVLHSLAESIGL